MTDPHPPLGSTADFPSRHGFIENGDGGEGEVEEDESEYTDEESMRHSSRKSERAGIQRAYEEHAVLCFRFVMLFILVAIMTAAGFCTYYFTNSDEEDDFEREFQSIAEAIHIDSSKTVSGMLGDCESLASTLTALAINSQTIWPFFTDSSFHVVGDNFRQQSGAQSVAIAPLVNATVRASWEAYALDEQGWIVDGLEWEGVEVPVPLDDISLEIFRREDDIEIVESGPGPFAPMWQTSQSPTDPGIINFNMLSNPTIGRVFETVQQDDQPVLSDLVDPVDFFGETAQTESPTSMLVYPLHASFEVTDLVGTLFAQFHWETFFDLTLQDGVRPVYVVVDDGCAEPFTFLIDGNTTSFQGHGDKHDGRYNEYVERYAFAPFLQSDHSNATGCQWVVNMYPTHDFYKEFNTERPAILTAVIVLVFFFTSIVFCIYDWAIHSRQQRIVAIAAQSEKILSKLYPTGFRDRLFGHGHEHTAPTPEEEDPPIKKKTPFHKKMRKSSVDQHKAAKFQLKNFMTEDAEGKTDSDTTTEKFDDKPIADLFPHTTVLFADIAGFTAWSSVREPSQVFTLLETVYHAFDSIAKKRRVFKVETVGDCYVAVTGLPEPRKDHALAMAKFSRESIEKFNELVGQLEVTLGPDTGDLGLRVGLHSGPVTAGVLRGDKSRFQLFGDTVNTAARIESTGKRNRIHLSMETAEQLQHSGKASWIRRREHEVEAKGKGKLQTFWLLLRESTGDGSSAGDDSSHGDVSEDFEPATPIPKELTTRPNLKAESADDIELPSKILRLVKWNVDVLVRLLKQIVAKRNAIGNRRNYDMMLSESEGKIRKKYMVLDEVVEIIPLPGFDKRIYRRQEDPNSIELPASVVEQMRLYVTLIACMYRDNNFHNFEHASHVMMSVSKLLSRITAADDLWNVNEDATKSKDFGWSMHDHTYGITSDPMTQFSVVLAALIHDVDHFGVSNFQLIKENHRIASLFKGKSVAEQNSIVLAWDTLMDPRFYELRRTIYADPFELERFRQLLANTVLATDIFDKQLQELRRNRWEVAFSESAENTVSTRDNINRKATIVIEHLIQASDVAHTMQHWHIYRKWNERLFAEMTVAFKSGKMEKNPAEFWYQGELGFFDNYIIPLAKKLKECGVFGVSSDEYLNYAVENRREWANNGEEVLAELLGKYQPPEEEKEEESAPDPGSERRRSSVQSAVSVDRRKSALQSSMSTRGISGSSN